MPGYSPGYAPAAGAGRDTPCQNLPETPRTFKKAPMDAAINPLLIADDTPLALPDFSRIRTSDFAPALQQATPARGARLAKCTCYRR